MSTHPELMDVAPYVLDALDPPEREAFREHLRTCAGCRTAVADLADLPGLLDLVPADVAAALADPDPSLAGRTGRAGSDPDWVGDPPASVLSALLAATRADEVTSRRRRRRVAGLVGAAAVVAAVAVTLVLGQLPWTQPPPTPVAQEVTLRGPEGTAPAVTASVELLEVDWGTRLEVECSYRAGSSGGYGTGTVDYVLVLTADDGGTEQVASWSARPGQDVLLPASSRLRPEQIDRIDLRTADGTTVLSAGL